MTSLQGEPIVRPQYQDANSRLEGERFRVVTDPSLTIAEFCAAEKIGRSKLYQLWREGRGPRFFLVGTHRRISHEARTEWRHQMENEAAAKGGV